MPSKVKFELGKQPRKTSCVSLGRLGLVSALTLREGERPSCTGVGVSRACVCRSSGCLVQTFFRTFCTFLSQAKCEDVRLQLLVRWVLDGSNGGVLAWCLADWRSAVPPHVQRRISRLCYRWETVFLNKGALKSQI